MRSESISFIIFILSLAYARVLANFENKLGHASNLPIKLITVQPFLTLCLLNEKLAQCLNLKRHMDFRSRLLNNEQVNTSRSRFLQQLTYDKNKLAENANLNVKRHFKTLKNLTHFITGTTLLYPYQYTIPIPTIKPNIRRILMSLKIKPKNRTAVLDHSDFFFNNVSKDQAAENTATEASCNNNEVIKKVEYPENNVFTAKDLAVSLDDFQRRFYKVTFKKLSTISPPDRQENGISFVQSSLFVYLLLVALASEVDTATKYEIDKCIGGDSLNPELIELGKKILRNLPASSDSLKLRWSSRLVLGPRFNTSHNFQNGFSSILRINVDRINGSESSEQLTKILNHMVEIDSGGAMHETFDAEEISGGLTAALLNTMYVRARWRAAPTLLNSSRLFLDDSAAPPRYARMIRLNDIMRYADLRHWDAQAIEISYATPGLTLLIIVPRGRSLRELAHHAANTSLYDIVEQMRFTRVAAVLPLYTLRMTLLLPSKLQAMGISRLVDATNSTSSKHLRLSHGVQRLMFWAEAGRNAFKDDGIEWDDPPDLDLIVDRPYIFFVRWHNITLMNGNFVL